MKHFTTFAFLALIFTVSHSQTSAQEVDEAVAIRQKAMMKIMPRSMGMVIQITGNGMTLNSTFLESGDEPDFQHFAGTTEEQYQEFSDYMLGTREIVREQMLPLMTRIAEETDDANIAELVGEWQATTLGVIANTEAKVSEILNPAQIAKIREFDLHTNQLMQQVGVPFFNFEGYSVLDLTAEQQKQIHGFRNEFLKEQQAMFDELSTVLIKPGSKPDPETMKKLAEKEKEIGERGKQLYARMKAEVHGVLTKEQLVRLDGILKETPECFTNMLKRRGTPPTKVDEKKYDDWQKSWKPGDPIPVEYRQREKARRTFP